MIPTNLRMALYSLAGLALILLSVVTGHPQIATALSLLVVGPITATFLYSWSEGSAQTAAMFGFFFGDVLPWRRPSRNKLAALDAAALELAQATVRDWFISCSEQALESQLGPASFMAAQPSLQALLSARLIRRADLRRKRRYRVNILFHQRLEEELAHRDLLLEQEAMQPTARPGVSLRPSGLAERTAG